MATDRTAHFCQEQFDTPTAAYGLHHHTYDLLQADLYQQQQQQFWPIAMTGYSNEQLEAICLSLYQARDGNRLVHLFQQIGPNEAWKTETILISYIFALFTTGDLERLFQIIQSHQFSPHNFKDLQDIWYNARYRESELRRGKELGAVEKYRLRRKFPPPKTIWDGEETVYSFKENSRKYLKQFYKQNKYPTMEQKREISRITNLHIVQISNWFKNRRQRDKSPSKGSPDSSSSTDRSQELPEFGRILGQSQFSAYGLSFAPSYKLT